jgi:hypothetical protein
MKFQLGDKVLVLHSKEEGEVVDIINDKMVMVDVRGVKFPAYTDQLDFPYFKHFTEKKESPEKKRKIYIDQLPVEKKDRVSKVANGVWLTFLPVFETDEFGEEVAVSLKIHLVNNSQQGYEFVYRLGFSGKYEFELRNQSFVFQDFYLHDIPFEDLNDSPVFEFDFSLMKPDKNKVEHLETSIKLRPKQVFARMDEIKQKGEATFSYKLFDEYPQRLVEEKIEAGLLIDKENKLYDLAKTRQHLEPPKQELDLHIEKIAEDWNSLSNFEMLSLQIQTFEKYLDLAIAHRQPSMVVIHGLGTGRLRDEVHELLRLKKQVKSFVNQYDPRYGYGATEIFFQY